MDEWGSYNGCIETTVALPIFDYCQNKKYIYCIREVMLNGNFEQR